MSDARAIVERAAARVLPETGHPFEDHLSFEHGFLPARPPLRSLPDSHAAWDQAARSLPDLHRRLRVCEGLAHLPLLSADEDALDQRYLQCAASVLGCIAHAYGLHDGGYPVDLPKAILELWTQVARRLGRPGPCLSFTDFVAHNWGLLDPHEPDPMRVENLVLLTPLVNNQEEHRIWTCMLEFLARATPILGAAIGAQEAAARDDFDAVEAHLVLIMDTLRELTFTTFMKVSPNPYSRHYADPVVSAKTAMSFAAGIIEGELGLSGASSPIFPFLDAFFGRTAYTSKYGKDMMDFRAWLPPAHQAVVKAVESFSLFDHIERSGRSDLEGLFFSTLSAYAGEKGYLGAHRLKLYTYIELGVRGGRTGTNGGFEGTVEERSWEALDDDIDVARRERFMGLPMHLHQARKLEVKASGGPVRQVVLDVEGTGVRYAAGDRVGILPRNGPALIDKTLAALRATGDEPVKLTSSRGR